MTGSWTLVVSRDDLASTTLLRGTVPELDEGEVLLRVDRVGLTANNITYAVLGASPVFRYWNFFPAQHGMGIVPLWGFAEVAQSRVPGVEAGSRVYGYLPTASHLIVKPGRVDARGFSDASTHRGDLPSLYNAYQLTTSDPAYQPQLEDLLILFRPLFWTSYLLADQLEDNGFYGADAIVMSSASSKTAYGAAFCLQGKGPRLAGLTSPRNVAFTEELGCYDQVLAYHEIAKLDPIPTTYVDFAGSAQVRTELRARLGDRLFHELIIGVTHQEKYGADALSGPRTSVFFAPDRMRKRIADVGRAGLGQDFARVWQRFAPVAETWVDIVVQDGPEALQAVWLQVLTGESPPRLGHILTL